MAKVIEFYVPTSFRKKTPKWIPPEQWGKLLHFRVASEEFSVKGRRFLGISLAGVVSRY